MTLTFSTLLVDAGIEAKGLMVMRHRPFEPAMRRKLPWIVAERPDLFLTYQAIQWKAAQAGLAKANRLAAFIGEHAGEAIFAGLFTVRGARALAPGEYESHPANSELLSLGMAGRGADAPDGLIFDLAPDPTLAAWIGKLVVKWPPPERSWWRWADRNIFPVAAITLESRFAAAMPAWEDLSLAWSELAIMPQSWKDRLREWRGVYFIFDAARERGYVGSACGKDNLLGRWLNYADTGHGGNKQLRASQPANLRFSILQRLSPDLPADEVVEIENRWKRRLHTREFGLNEN